LANNISKSKLKGVDTLLKDERYRGMSAKRKDLFQGPGIMNDSLDDDEEAEINAGSDFECEETSDREAASASSDDMSAGSDTASDASDSENEQDSGEDGDQKARRDKVRQLLAQENKYIAPSVKMSSNLRTVAEQLSESTQVDAEKGRDIKTQQVSIFNRNKLMRM
jgi:hypothetical protein